MKIKIGDITKIRTGKLDANAADENGQYPFFTCSKEPLKINTYSYDCECVLVAGNGDLNVKYYNGKFDAYQRTYIIENDSDGLLFMPYLYFFMESYIDELRKQSIGGVIKYIKLKNLTDALIELPSIEVQRKIVNIISKSKEIVRRKENEFELLDELVRARFVEMFGDPVTNDMLWNTDVLKDICTKIGSGSTPRGGKESYIDEGISLIRSMNVHNANFEYKDLAHITLDQAEKLNNVVVEHDDLLFNITGASVARCCVVPSDVLPARVNQHVCILRCIEKINPIFLQELLVNENYQDKLLQIAKSGATREAINKQQLESLEIMIPPLELQNQFASFVQEIDKSRSRIQKSLEASQELFDSLMQEYFG